MICSCHLMVRRKHGHDSSEKIGADLKALTVDFQEYAFDLIFTSTRIQVKVDGVVELDYTGSFTDGAFGFYNYSQPTVLYAGITEENLPDPCDTNPPGQGGCPATGQVPVPGTLWLMGLAILGLGQMRRKLA